MARLKFVVFAVVAIGLWAFHLTRVSSIALGASTEQAQAAVAGASGPVAVALESRRSLVQAAALKLGGSPAALNAGPKAGGKVEAPTVDRFAAVRGAVSEAIDAELKEALFVAVQNEAGVLLARGTGEPLAAAPEGLDLAGVAQAGAAGALRTVEGAPYFVVAVPMLVSDKNEVKASGFAAVGLPLLPDAKVLEQAQKSLGLSGLALVSQGKVVLSVGDKGGLEGLAGKLKPGQTQATGSGPVRGVGPLDLPMLVDAEHGQAGLSAIGGTGYEVLATASSKASVDALADYQVFAFGGLAALALLAVVVLVLIGGGEEHGPAMVMPAPVPVPQVVSPAARRDEPVAPAPLSFPEQEPAPEASPDDFDFPASSPSSVASSPSSFAISSPSAFSSAPPVATGSTPAFEPEPMSDPFAQAAPPPAPPPPPVATSEQAAYVPPGGLNDDMEEGQRTVNYPVFKPGMAGPAGVPPAADPFAMAAAQMGDEGLVGGEDNPESTRVAAVPQELIRAARAGGTTTEKPALKTGSIPKIGSVPPAGAASEEDRHFQEVFRDFVATREKCGEPADGLTFDKFKTKLLKNKEQLVAKYACRTVRFQVYVKDGKAALKATPVKD